MIFSLPMLVTLTSIFLCWGSFLNMVGYRIIRGHSFQGRSFCPHCRVPIAWYDLIPVISFCILKGRCRNCQKRISALYPAIELLTALMFLLLINCTDPQYWLAYSIFISASLVTIRTDFDQMLIARMMTWGIVPCAFLASYLHHLPITLPESIIGCLFGYAFLYTIAWLYRWRRNEEGLGEGDLDLIALIGAFLGPLGAWHALMFGSLLGLLTGIAQMLIANKKIRFIAFGPWLIFGAFIFLFTDDYLKLLWWPENFN